jgi:hypothetical protein
VNADIECSLSKSAGLVDLLRGGVSVGESELFHGVVLDHGRAAVQWRRRSSIGNRGALEFTRNVESFAELPAVLAVDAVVDGVENSVDDLVGCVFRLRAGLVDTGADKNRVPCVCAVLVVLVGAADVGFGSVADEIDSLRRRVDTVSRLTPLLEETGGELKGADLGLAESGSDQFVASHGLEHGFERATKSAHTEASKIVGCRPHDVVVREEDRRAFVEVLGAGVEHTALGQKQIKNDLLVTSPISAVGEDKDGLDDSGGEVAISRVVPLFFCQLPERCGIRVCLNDVARSDNILETVALSDVSALLALAAHDENGLVLVSHLPHGCVTANELSRRNFDLHLLAELDTAFLFGLATTISNENVRTAERQCCSITVYDNVPTS